jgi:PEGA domain
MRRTTLAVLIVPIALLGLGGGVAAADDTPEAAKHFQRGVALFGEADYKSAVVEFKRAYALAPNAQVLYNIGETEFQLQDYAAALLTFQRFLVDAAPADPQRPEVERNVRVLRTRVGHLRIVTVPAEADVAIDGHPIGKTPFPDSVLVSIGQRQVTASFAGRPPMSRWIDIAADDDASVMIQLPAPQGSTAAPRALSTPPPAHDGGGATLRLVGWITTGVLAAGAVTFGILAVQQSSELATARNTYPVQPSTLTNESSLASTYSILADSLGAAALVVGGITLFSTVTSGPASSSAHGGAGGLRVGIGPGSARVDVTF